MKTTSAERMRSHREKKRAAVKAAPDAAGEFVGSSFASFADHDEEARHQLRTMGETLNSFGMEMPDLTKDEDPEWQEYWGYPNRGALSRAERMADGLLDCARFLAETINRFKIAQIEAAQARLVETDLADPVAKAKALADAVRLDNMKRRLSKEVRHSFPATTVKGE